MAIGGWRRRSRSRPTSSPSRPPSSRPRSAARWANEPGVPGVIRVLDPWRWARGEPEPVAEHLAYIEEVMQYEGPHTIAAFIMETVTGTNGILIPPDGYLQGVRELYTKYGILMIAD